MRPRQQLILGRYGWWNRWLLAGPVALQIPDKLDSIDNASRSKAPAIFILSGSDELIPPRYHQLVVSAYAGPKRVINISGARHDSPLPAEAARQFADEVDRLWREAGIPPTMVK